MKFLINTVSIAIAGGLLSLVLPWWVIAIVAFVVAAISRSGVVAGFFAGFAGGALLWGAASFWIDSQNNGILSAKIASFVQLPEPALLIAITAVVGGLVAGLAGATGSLLRLAFR